MVRNSRDTTVFLFPHAPPSLFRGKTTEGVAGSVAVRVGGAALLRSRGKFVDDARTPAAREALVLACLRHLVAVARKVGRHAGVLQGAWAVGAAAQAAGIHHD